MKGICIYLLFVFLISEAEGRRDDNVENIITRLKSLLEETINSKKQSNNEQARQVGSGEICLVSEEGRYTTTDPEINDFIDNYVASVHLSQKLIDAELEPTTLETVNAVNTWLAQESGLPAGMGRCVRLIMSTGLLDNDHYHHVVPNMVNHLKNGFFKLIAATKVPLEGSHLVMKALPHFVNYLVKPLQDANRDVLKIFENRLDVNVRKIDGRLKSSGLQFALESDPDTVKDLLVRMVKVVKFISQTIESAGIDFGSQTAGEYCMDVVMSVAERIQAIVITDIDSGLLIDMLSAVLDVDELELQNLVNEFTSPSNLAALLEPFHLTQNLLIEAFQEATDGSLGAAHSKILAQFIGIEINTLEIDAEIQKIMSEVDAKMPNGHDITDDSEGKKKIKKLVNVLWDVIEQELDYDQCTSLDLATFRGLLTLKLTLHRKKLSEIAHDLPVDVEDIVHILQEQMTRSVETLISGVQDFISNMATDSDPESLIPAHILYLVDEDPDSLEELFYNLIKVIITRLPEIPSDVEVIPASDERMQSLQDLIDGWKTVHEADIDEAVTQILSKLPPGTECASGLHPILKSKIVEAMEGFDDIFKDMELVHDGKCQIKEGIKAMLGEVMIRQYRMVSVRKQRMCDVL